MVIKYVLPMLAIAGVGLAVYTVAAQNREVKVQPPVAQPASAPYSSNVPGAGLVEPSTEFVAIGSHVSGVVTKVYVAANQQAKAGDALFSIDDRSLKAELATREAAIAVAQSQLDRLAALPRVEQVPPYEAKVREEESNLRDLSAKLEMWENLTDKRAVSAEELSARRFAVQTAQARVMAAKAQLDELKAGAWKPDVEISRANLEAARADAARIRTEIERLTVRAPVDAEVLKVNVRTGEFAQAGVQETPLMVLGATNTLHIRVDVDENDAWRVRDGAKGHAYIRGNSKLSTPIEFVRFEPYVVPKRSLTGASSERVDTRVLQVIYRFDRAAFEKANNARVFVGQQMDVFLDAPPIGDAKFGADAEQARQDLERKVN
jgi:multidrug resistance efflux pump